MAGNRLGMITVRPMTADDVAAVAQLEAATYATPWSAQVFRDELAQASRVYLVADDSDGIAGYGGLFLVGDEGHITTMAVAGDRRGTGLGTRLMLHLVEAGLELGMRHLTLEVRPSNTAAQALYQKFGLERVGVRKNYYPDEDALIMWANHVDSPQYAELLAELRSRL